MLSRIYDSEGGVEVLDVLMKYLYVASFDIHSLSRYSEEDFPFTPALLFITHLEITPNPLVLNRKLRELTRLLVNDRYKGMAHSSKPSSASTGSMSPQPTGFSQIHSRGGGEGGGQAMSVLLSWHEKLVEIAGPGSIVRVMSDRRTV